jgi:hypothetical protein
MHGHLYQHQPDVRWAGCHQVEGVQAAATGHAQVVLWRMPCSLATCKTQAIACVQERKKGAGRDDDYSFLLRLVSRTAHFVGFALAAVALVLSIHAFVLFKGQKSAFMFVLPNSALRELRLTIVLAAALLGWSVLYTIYAQTRLTDIALIDWERPRQVHSHPLYVYVFHSVDAQLFPPSS